MELEQAIKVMLDAQDKLRTRQGVSDPDFMSEQMQRLAQATGAVETHLAGYEKDYEIRMGQKLYQYLVTEGTSATNADKRTRIDLAELKGEIAYLSRIVSSAWKQTSTTQSRHNHLTREFRMGANIT